MASLVDLYDPDFYSVDVLQQNRDKWPCLFQECYQEMLSIIMETDDAVGLTDNVRVELVKAKEDMKKTIREYITKFNNKLSSSSKDDSSSAADAQVESDQTSVNPKIEGKEDKIIDNTLEECVMTRITNQCCDDVPVICVSNQDSLHSSPNVGACSFLCFPTYDTAKGSFLVMLKVSDEEDETSHDDLCLVPFDVIAGHPEPEPPPLFSRFPVIQHLSINASFHHMPSQVCESMSYYHDYVNTI